jgi:phospholipase/carboxylesterase
MHGYGADMDDLLPLSSAFCEDSVCYSLNAPGLLPSPEGTIEGRSWFNLISSPFGMDYDMDDVHDSASAVKAFVEEKKAEEKPEKIFLLGFSQGACLVHYLLLRYPQLIDGGIAFSGRFVDEVFEGSYNWELIKSKKLLMSHGKIDLVIPYESGSKISQYYRDHEMNFDKLSFNGGHEIPISLFKKLKTWFAEAAND